MRLPGDRFFMTVGYSAIRRHEGGDPFINVDTGVPGVVRLRLALSDEDPMKLAWTDDGYRTYTKSARSWRPSRTDNAR